MRWLLFLSRLAFISGICILLALSRLIWEWKIYQEMESTVIIIGFVIGMIVIPVTLLCYLGVIFARKTLTAIVPLWLVISNILWLIVLLFYIIGINAQGHNTP
jgi:hypothetical protein